MGLTLELGKRRGEVSKNVSDAKLSILLFFSQDRTTIINLLSNCTREQLMIMIAFFPRMAEGEILGQAALRAFQIL